MGETALEWNKVKPKPKEPLLGEVYLVKTEEYMNPVTAYTMGDGGWKQYQASDRTITVVAWAEIPEMRYR